MNDTPEHLEATIAGLQAQRALLGDALVDAALAPLQRELAALRARQPAAVQQLKQATVLFVDVVGSTAIGEQLGPEEIHAVMDGALERFTAVVQRHHGRVLQYTGDGMLAAFGADESHEDDVEGAVRAGLGIIEAAVQLAPLMRQLHGVPDFNVRAGVHTGTVLLGGGVDAEGSIRGATVNFAARMEQSAPAGRLRISHDSYRHVRGLFEVIEQPPISVKGVALPQRSYLVERAKPRAFRVATRGIDGVQAPMVGRAAELAQLQAALDGVARDGRARAVTVVAEAGVGKSRLLAEFAQTLDLNRCWMLLGRAHPRTSLQPFDLLRDMLARQFQIGEADPAPLARSKLVDGLTLLLRGDGDRPADRGGDGAGEAAIHRLGHLIGLDFSASPHVKDLLGDERQFRQLAFEAAAHCLRQLSASNLVVLVLDDLHWADSGTLEFMRFVLRSNRHTPLLAVMLTRPVFFEQHPDWIGAQLSAVSNTETEHGLDHGLEHLRLDLRPLDKALSHELADSLLQRLGAVPVALRALITGGAEGNPFYMEELVKMLIDDGVIQVEPTGWRVLSDKLLSARVPPTLAGVLQARLDALGLAERTALQHAALVGHVFWDQALMAIAPAAATALPTLLRKQLIVRHDAPAVDGTREYAFAHNLLHQVTYDGVLKAPKRHGHARVGEFWSTRAQVAEPQDVNPAACRALAEAQFHRCLSDAQAYAVWFDAQFTNYLNAYAARTLRPLADQLIGICEQHFGSGHEQTAKALTNLGRVILQQGGVDAALPLLQRALAIQEQALSADHPDLARTLAVLGGYHQGRGDWRAAEPYFRRALEMRERSLGAEHPLTLGTLDNLAKTMLELGQLEPAETLSRRVLAARQRGLGPDHPDTAFAMTALGEVLAKRGDFTSAEPLIRGALARQQAALPVDHPDIGLSMWHLAETLRALGRCDEAEPLARSALTGWESSFGPDHEWTAWGLISLAEVRLAQGAATEAAELADRAATILQGLFGPQHAVVLSTMNLHARALGQLAPG